MRQIKQEAFFTGTSAQGSKARSGNDSFRDTSGRSSRVRGYFSALGNGPVSARHARASCNPNLPPPHSRRLDHHADGAGQVPRSSNRFGTVLALLTALFVMALWAPPAQAAPPGEPMYLSTQWLGASVKLTWNRLYDTTITKYQERHKSGSDLDSSDSWNDIPDSGPSTANHTFTGLTNDTEYQFQVRAVNADGNGVDSEIVTATPNAAAPRVASIKRGKDGQGQDIGSPTNYFLLRWLVTFSEPVHIDPTDFLISIGGRNEHPSLALSGTSETTWSVSRRGSVGAHNGDVTLSFAASPNIKDFAGVKLTNKTPTTGTNEHTFMVDNTEPTVKSITRQAPMSSQTANDEVTWQVTFSEGVKNVVAADFKVSGTTATLTATKATDATWDVKASGGNLATLNGTVTLAFKTVYSIEDLAGAGVRSGNALISTAVSGTNHNTYAIRNAGPGQPGNFTATAGDTQVTLNWSDPSDSTIDNYEIRQKAGTAAFGSWADITSSGATTTTHTVSSLSNGTTYGFQIRAVDDGTNAGPASDTVTATPSADFMPVLTDITDKRYVQGAVVDFTLPAATGGDGHPSYAYTLTPNVSGAGLTFTASTHKLTGTPGTPKAKVTYTYTATESSDSDGTTESASKPFTIGIQPKKPANFTAAAGNEEVMLSWTAIAGVAGWEVKQDTGSWTYITNSDTDTDSHEISTGLINGTAYRFNVRALVGSGNTLVNGIASDDVLVTPAKDKEPVLWNQSNRVFLQGSEITGDEGDFTLALNGDGHPNYIYTLTPDVSGIGLTFVVPVDPESPPKLTGMPSAPLAKTSYIYTAAEKTDDDGATESTSKTFTIGVRPMMPVNFTAAAGDTEVTLSWTAIPGVTYWWYQHTSVTTPWKNITGTGDTANSHTITGLTNGTPYTFRIITAVGTTGATVLYSSATDWVSVTPVPDPIPALPVIVDQSYTQGTAVDFPLPTATGGDGDGYTYTLTPASPAGLTFNASTRKLTGTPTAPLAKTTYTYTATETNDSDGANESASSTFTIGIQPQEPANFTAAAGDTKVDLAWTAIAGVAKWQVKQDTLAWTDIASSGAATNSHTVTSLTNGTEYTFKVRAVVGTSTNAVIGVESKAETATPSDDLSPALPTVADKLFVQGTAVDFTLPAATGGDSHPNYTYTLTPNVSGIGLTFTASTHKLGGTPSAPKAKVSYTYTATESSDSDGATESASKTFTIGIQPKKPANFTAAAGDTEVTLAWTAIAGVAKWQVKQDTLAWTDISGSGAATNRHTVTGLTNGTEYSFKVRAVVGTGNAAVDGVESDAKPATPGMDPPPRVRSIERQTPKSSPTNADELTWRVTFSEVVENVVANAFTVSGTTATLAVAPGTPSAVYGVTASGGDLANYNGTVTLNFARSQDITDVTGNPLANTMPPTGNTNDNTFEVDNTSTVTPPTVTPVGMDPTVRSIERQMPESSPTSADTLTWRVTFSERVKDMGTADFAVGGTTAAVSAVASASLTETDKWDVTVSGGDLKELNGTVTLGFADGHYIRDNGNNRLTDTTPPTGNTNDNTFEVDNTAPTVEITGVPATANVAFTATFTFSESVTGFEVGDITLSGATASGFTGSGTIYTATITPTNDYKVEVAANVATDSANNGNMAATAVSGTYDTTPPTVEISDVPATANAAFTATFTFSESVTGFEVGDITLSGATASGFTGSGTNYTATITPTNDYKVEVAANVATDSANNGNVAATAVSGTYYAPAERRVVKNILAAIAQATLSSASGTIERRFSSSPGNEGFTLTGGMAELTPLETEGNPQANSFDQWDEDEESVVDSRDVDVENLLQSSAFELSSGNEAAAWTFWGRGDLTQFEGRPDGASYDGSLRSGWLGFDARVNGNILAGLAVSRSSGDADYGFGDNGGGKLETDLTSVHPYAQLVTGGGGSLRILGGVGWGEARNKASDRDMETRDLKMTMVSVGTRWPVLRIGNLNLSVKGDTGLVRLETDGDGKIGGIGGLSVDAWRMKGGVEVAHDGLRLSESGMTLSPLGSLSLRHDGGDGITGTGVEVEGGVRLATSGSRFGLEARGRWLTLHSEDGYGERGMSLEARITPGAGGRGLSLSVGPQWGAAVEGTDALWRDEAFVRGSGSSVNKAQASLAARAGYGFGVGGGVLTPFVEMDVAEGESERRRYGTGVELGLWNIHGRTVDAALAGERLEGSSLEPENRIGLDLRMSF